MRALVILSALSLAACHDDGDALRAEVQFLVVQEGAAVEPAVERVAKRGVQALPSIEAAMHTAEPHGRKNLILAMRRIGDGEAIPLLRHIALYDAAPDVKLEARWTLERWAVEKDARGERARAALREIDERSGREEAG